MQLEAMLTARRTSVTNGQAHGLSTVPATAPGSSSGNCIGSVTAVACSSATPAAATAPHQGALCNVVRTTVAPSHHNCARHVYISHLIMSRMKRGVAPFAEEAAHANRTTNTGSAMSMSHAGPGKSSMAAASGASGGSGADGQVLNGSGATSGRSVEPLKRLRSGATATANGILANGNMQLQPAALCMPQMLPQRSYAPNSLLLMPPGTNLGLPQPLQCLPLLAAAAASMPGGAAGLSADPLVMNARPDCWLQKQMMLQTPVPPASQH
jgi:hypothetical protein